MRKVGIISGSYLLNVWNGLGRHTNSLAWGLSNSLLAFDVTVFIPSDRDKTYTTQDGQSLVVHVALPNAKKIASVPLEMLDAWNEEVSKLIASYSFDYIILPRCESWPSAKKYLEDHPSCQIIGYVAYLYKDAQWILAPDLKNKICSIEQDFLANASKLVSHTMQIALATASAANREVYVVPNSDRTLDRPSPLFTPNPNTICYVGRMSKTKALETLLRAMSMVPEEIILSISSPEDSDAYANKLRTLAASLNISHRVNILGWMNTIKVKALYRSSALAVVTGIAEPYGYGVLDPLYIGTPVIVSEFSGLVDYLPDKLDTYTNVKSLATLIADKLSIVDPFAQRKSHQNYCAQNFSVSSVTKTLEEILK